MTNTIVILAAGMSSRMKKSTDSSIGSTKADEANKKSKSLITFGNKPFIFFLLENIVDAGFQNVIMVVGQDYEDFKNEKGNLELVYNSKKYLIPCDRRFEINSDSIVIGFISNGCF